MAIEKDIIVVNDEIEVHPAAKAGFWSVVRNGAVYGTYTRTDAIRIAKELAKIKIGRRNPQRAKLPVGKFVKVTAARLNRNGTVTLKVARRAVTRRRRSR